VTINTSKIAEKLVPIPQHQVQQAIQQTLSAPSPTTHNLCERKGKIDYQALHLGQEIKKDIQQAAHGIKDRCKTMRKSIRKLAKAAITKLAPGAFSPQQPSPATAPSSLDTSPLFPGISGPQKNTAEAVPDQKQPLQESKEFKFTKFCLCESPDSQQFQFAKFCLHESPENPNTFLSYYHFFA
jgi:hypothetical protein